MSATENLKLKLQDVSDEEEEHEEQSSFSHDDLVQLTKEAISNIIESDPLLSDLPLDPTVEEIRAQIAVAQGQAIVLYLEREHLPRLSIVVPPRTTTVLELKKAVKRHTNLALKRERVKNKISWKHVWKKYYLSFDDVPLKDDGENIQTYGICNKAVLKYVKKKREKNKIK